MRWEGQIAGRAREGRERRGNLRESGLKTCAKSTGALFFVTTRFRSSPRLFGVMAGSTPLAAIPVCREFGSTRFR